ncbi:serine/threonine-protein kinase [Kitasatospora albolonga]|uniref:serine/threonine-protein kinase n=1 Tax=Kitasatospora albolonga TaxID=68173 RepID=UPI0031E6428A
MARKIGSRYTVQQVIGRGSAGTVWLGEGPDGPVAVKLLREDLASDQVLVGRFVQERAALTSLDHPNVVEVRDMVVDGDDLALVMELVQGTDPALPAGARGRAGPCRRRLGDRRTWPTAWPPRTPPGSSTATSKPENVLLDLAAPAGPGGAPRAKLTDFGIARLVDAPRRTRATRIIGTPDYLAPEIIEGLEPRAAVDIYALATVLYELLTGFTPFGGGHTGAVLRRHVTEQVPAVPGLPEGLSRIITECLAKAPASRLRAAELATRLREQLPYLVGLPPQLPPERAEAEAPAHPGRGGLHRSGRRPGTHRRRRGPAVPLVQAPLPDSTRDTHTSLRRPLRPRTRLLRRRIAGPAPRGRSGRTPQGPPGAGAPPPALRGADRGGAAAAGRRGRRVLRLRPGTAHLRRPTGGKSTG